MTVIKDKLYKKKILLLRRLRQFFVLNIILKLLIIEKKIPKLLYNNSTSLVRNKVRGKLFHK